jgi:hypothetical protein
LKVKQLIPEILDIIAEHDTRKGFASVNDGLMRDADKLWRFSQEGFWADVRRFKHDKFKRKEKLEKDIEKQGFFFSKEAKQLAKSELKKRMKEDFS